MDTIRESKECRVGFATQADFDVPAVDGANVTEISVEAFDIESGVKRHEINGQYGSKNPTVLNTVNSSQGAISNFTTVGALNVETADEFLYTHFQDVIELADTEFTKTFNYCDPIPDFSANAGHFLTFIKRFPTASASYKIGGCIAKSFKISGERDGLIMLECGWVGMGVPSYVSNPSGTWALNDPDEFLEFNDMASATLMVEPVTLSPFNVILQSFSLEGQFDVEGIGHDATDGFASYGLSNRSGKFSITILRDTNIDEIITGFTAGALVTLAIDLGKLSFSVTGQIESLEDSKDGLAAVTVNCNFAADINESTGVVADANMLQLVIQNSHDRAWPAA